MYKLQLIRKYLFKRRIAWVALVAVMLCTAMVLVVVSVMGGWLKTFQESSRGMGGDVVITSRTESLGGFPFYQEMLDRVRKLPDVAAAVPIIRTGGMININNIYVQLVQVLGYPTDIGSVNEWPSSLHLNVTDRKKELEDLTKTPGTTDDDRKRIADDVANLPFSLHPDIPYQFFVNRNAKNARNRPGLIVSSTLLGLRHDRGPAADSLLQDIYRYPVTLTMVPVTGGEPISLESVQPIPFWIVDDSRSRLWQLDNNNVYMSFDEAQRDLRMSASEGSDARCSEVQIKAKPDVDLVVLKDQVIKLTDQVREAHEIPQWYDFKVETWMEQRGEFIKAVQNEVVLTTVLFGIISMVAVLLIFCIFYMIVVEKTKDIGIIKSVGATGSGILSLFMGYGLAIGVIGAALGFGVAFFFVRYINELHAWLGRQMGIVIWSPETYQFDKIPSRMDTSTVIYVLATAVLAALVGALVPAMRAAIMNPVEALRYE